MPIDLALSASGDLPERLSLVSGSDTTLQRVRRRLLTHLGEVLTDSSLGVPWMTWVASRRFPLDAATAWLRAQIETCPGVVRLDDWTGAQDGEAATFTGTVVTSSGAIPIELRPLGSPGAPNTSGSFRLLTGAARR